MAQYGVRVGSRNEAGQSRRTRERCLARVAAPAARQRHESLAQEGAFRVGSAATEARVWYGVLARRAVRDRRSGSRCGVSIAPVALDMDNPDFNRAGERDCPRSASQTRRCRWVFPIWIAIAPVELIVHDQHPKRDGVGGCSQFEYQSRWWR
jgi:hypothetical protein